MNKITIIGNITKDINVRSVNINGDTISVCDMDIAVNEGYGDNKKVNYFRATCWRGLADVCGKYLGKGKKVMVSGPIHLETREYNGKTYANMVINVIDLEMLSSRNDAGATEPEATKTTKETPAVAPIPEVSEDELPF